MANILLCVTGGIAAYKIPELIRRLVKDKCRVKTILTECGAKLCAPDAIRAVSGDSVYTDLFAPVFLEEGHTKLADWADALVVAPATANTIAKLALGISDNLLTTTYLASDCPKLIVPAMHSEMFQSNVTQKNLKTLEAQGDIILPPETGELASGDYGIGRMPGVGIIADAAIRAAAGDTALCGKTVVISAGATAEPIDDVRIITNRSSGKMGIALARAAYRMGADVVLLWAGPDTHALPPVCVIRAQTVEEMQTAYRRLAPKADLFIAAAAIGDFIPAKTVRGKIKRGGKNISLEFKAAPDLLADAAKRKKRGQIFVGFALETVLDEKSAKSKLLDKKLDVIFLNTVAAMGADRAGGILVDTQGRREAFDAMPKSDLAENILKWITARR